MRRISACCLFFLLSLLYLLGITELLDLFVDAVLLFLFVIARQGLTIASEHMINLLAIDEELFDLA